MDADQLLSVSHFLCFSNEGRERPHWSCRSWWSAGPCGSAWPRWISWSTRRRRRQGQCLEKSLFSICSIINGLERWIIKSSMFTCVSWVPYKRWNDLQIQLSSFLILDPLLWMQGEVGEHGQKGGKGAKGEHVSQTGSWQLTWYQTVQGDCSCRCWSGFCIRVVATRVLLVHLDQWVLLVSLALL